MKAQCLRMWPYFWASLRPRRRSWWTAGTDDRRRIALKLKPVGRRIYQRAVESAERFLADHLAALKPDVRGELLRTMQALHSIFDDPPETRRAAARRQSPND
jgi:hypothetical protein